MSNPTLEALLGRGDDYQPREAWQLAWARREQLEKTRVSDGTSHADEGLLPPSSSLKPQLHAPAATAPAVHAGVNGTPAGRQSEAQHGLTTNPSPSASTASVLHSIHAQQQRQRGPPDIHVLRSSQLDASRLDTELSSMLHEQLLKAFSLFQPGRVSEYEPELTALLRLLIFGFSIWRGHATPGSQLLNLRYRNERSSTPAGAGHTGSTQFSAGSGRSKSLNSSSPSSSGVGASGSGRGGSAATSTSSRPSSALPSAASVPLLGGKTGVEGPGLSLQQRLALGAGMVVVPYLWARLGRMAARGWQGGWLGHSQQSAGEAWVTWGDDLDSQQTAGEEPQHSQQHHLQEPALEPTSPADPASEQHIHPRPALSPGHVLTQPFKRLWARLCLALARLHLRSGGMWGVMQRVEGLYRAAALVNLLAFLAGGKYRSLLERLVGARLVYRQATMTRIISFEYLNRQLVWQEVSELLLFLLPLLDGLRARGTLSRLLPRLPDPRAVLAQGSAAVVAAISSGVARVAGGAAGGQQESLTGSTSTTGVEGGAQGGAQGASGTPTPAGSPVAGTSGKEASKGGTEARQPQQQVQQQAGAGAGMERQGSTASTVVPVTRPTGPCPVCGTQEPLLPLLAVPCGHCFCYYCLAARTAANRQFACPLDGVRVAAMERWRPGRKVTSVLA